MVINKIVNWFKQAKPTPTNEDLCVQIGCHFEEVAEFAEALSPELKHCSLVQLADMFKNKDEPVMALVNDLNREDRIKMLDALGDQSVTGTGVATFMGADFEGALEEINRSNYSKFDADGKPIFNEQGKIMKGENYTKPELEQFV